MIKLLDILENKILIPRRSKEERQKKFSIIINKQIQQYIKDGSKGDLNLSKMNVPILPDNLIVGGNLFMYNSKISLLPNNLTVKGKMVLNSSTIQSLPDNLTVIKGLYIIDTNISLLPKNLKVQGDFVLYDTPLSKKYTEKQIRQMSPGIKGDIKI